MNINTKNMDFYQILELHPYMDIKEQFEEIKDVINLLHDKRKELYGKIESIKVCKSSCEEANLNGIQYKSAYKDIACSMAAVGLLAPFFESLFSRSFEYMRDQDANSQTSKHNRWICAKENSWDCHYYFGKSNHPQKNITKGIIQLVEATNLKDRFPNNLESILSALFAYRNKMFDGGYEWELKDREKFWKRVEEKWNVDKRKWFENATQGDCIWMIYMSDEFINECLECIKKCITEFSSIFDEFKGNRI
ncbi:MAG: hypothetical protein ACIAQZ_04760 [Sedimentisphaeraceae bacterium JB056]